MIQADGTDARVISNSLSLQGDPAWAPDGQSIISAVIESGMPHLFRIPINGGAPSPLSMNSRSIQRGLPMAISLFTQAPTLALRFL